MILGLSAIDWVVLAGYLSFVACVGFWSARGQRSARDYFLGSRSLPWWAATLSIIATETSAATFVGFPAEAFGEDWSLLQLVLGFVAGRLFLAFLFVPAFYRQDFLTVYGFLASRFGDRSRVAASVLFVLGRLVASGVRLWAGCFAVHVATGLPVEAVILALGVFGSLFTLVGGIRAVVWTDVVLGVTLVGAGVLSAIVLVGEIPGGLTSVLSATDISEKTAIFHGFSGWHDPKSFVAGLAGGFVLTLATHGTDQDIAQRMLTCRNSAGGSLSLVGSAVLIVPLVLLFLAVGTLLYYFHELGSPGYEAPAGRLNEVFPLFIGESIPKLAPGLAGIVLAGLIAAALSSFTSVLNALASTTIGDFYEPLLARLGRTGQGNPMRASRLATGFWSGALILTALAFVNSQETIIQQALKVLTYFYGGFLGAFLVGILTRRGTDRTVLTGMLLSCPVVWLLQLRAYLADPDTAPGVLQGFLTRLPETVTSAVLEVVPDIAWPYWIVIGTLVSFTIGVLGSPRGVPADRR